MTMIRTLKRNPRGAIYLALRDNQDHRDNSRRHLLKLNPQIRKGSLTMSKLNQSMNIMSQRSFRGSHRLHCITIIHLVEKALSCNHHLAWWPRELGLNLWMLIQDLPSWVEEWAIHRRGDLLPLTTTTIIAAIQIKLKLDKVVCYAWNSWWIWLKNYIL